MKTDYKIWNILHDGVLVDIIGTVPGYLTIRVEIEYLANKLNGQEDSIFVILKNCTLFEYERQWTKDEAQLYKNLSDLEGISPSLMVLSCDEMDDHLLIYDICGSLKIRYDTAELTLKNGDPLTFQELNNASKEYWDNFGSKDGT